MLKNKRTLSPLRNHTLAVQNKIVYYLIQILIL